MTTMADWLWDLISWTAVLAAATFAFISTRNLRTTRELYEKAKREAIQARAYGVPSITLRLRLAKSGTIMQAEATRLYMVAKYGGAGADGWYQLERVISSTGDDLLIEIRPVMEHPSLVYKDEAAPDA